MFIYMHTCIHLTEVVIEAQGQPSHCHNMICCRTSTGAAVRQPSALHCLVAFPFFSRIPTKTP